MISVFENPRTFWKPQTFHFFKHEKVFINLKPFFCYLKYRAGHPKTTLSSSKTQMLLNFEMFFVLFFFLSKPNWSLEPFGNLHRLRASKNRHTLIIHDRLSHHHSQTLKKPSSEGNLLICLSMFWNEQKKKETLKELLFIDDNGL